MDSFSDTTRKYLGSQCKTVWNSKDTHFIWVQQTRFCLSAKECCAHGCEHLPVFSIKPRHILFWGIWMIYWLMHYSRVTLLTSFKALLQTSYLGESLGVFWQIVCNEVKEEQNQLICFSKWNKTNVKTYPLIQSKLNNVEQNMMSVYDNDIKIQLQNYKIVFKHTGSEEIQGMAK